jgi:hypothetical protein
MQIFKRKTKYLHINTRKICRYRIGASPVIPVSYLRQGAGMDSGIKPE